MGTNRESVRRMEREALKNLRQRKSVESLIG